MKVTVPDLPIDRLGFNEWRGKYSNVLRGVFSNVATDPGDTGRWEVFSKAAWEEQRRLETSIASEPPSIGSAEVTVAL